jgi:hypothetical protein
VSAGSAAPLFSAQGKQSTRFLGITAAAPARRLHTIFLRLPHGTKEVEAVSVGINNY